MRHLLTPLIWKELRERRLFLSLGLVWTLLGIVYLLTYELGHRYRDPVASFHTTASLFGLLAGVLVAMRTARGETTDRTRGFSDGLPIPRPLRAAVRLAGGFCALAVPIAVGAFVLSLLLGAGIVEQAYPAARAAEPVYVPMLERASLSRPAAVGFAWYVAAIEIASASWLLLLATALGTLTRSESRAGYAGAALAAASLLFSDLRIMFDQEKIYGGAQWACALFPAARTILWGYGTETGDYADIDIGRGFGWTLPVNVLLQVAFALWLVRRMATLADWRSDAKEGAAPGRIWIPRLLPLPTRGVALAWLAVRHALPMAIPGILFAVAITGAEWIRNRPHVEMVNGEPVVVPSHFPGEGVALFGDLMSQSTWFLAAIWCVVVGAGLFASEADSRIGEFWRTRPIAPAGLFTMKFLAGLVVTLLVLDGPAIALSWNSPAWGNHNAMNWPHVAVMVPLHATLFAVAVACTCLTRHAAIGGVLTFVLVIATIIVTQAIPALDPLQTYNTSRFTDRFVGAVLAEGASPADYQSTPSDLKPEFVLPDGTVLPAETVFPEGFRLPAGTMIQNAVPLLPSTYPLLAGAMGLITALSLALGLWSLKRYRPVLAVP